MSKYDPQVFFGTERFNAEKANNLKEAEVEALQEQNSHLKQLAESAAQATKTAEESAKSSEKSAKHSKICTIISVVIAGLMLVVTVLSLSFDFWKFKKEHKAQSTSQSEVFLSNQELL